MRVKNNISNSNHLFGYERPLFDEIIDNWMVKVSRTGESRNVDFIKKMIVKNRLNHISINNLNEKLEIFEFMIEGLNEVYGEDWDFYFRPVGIHNVDRKISISFEIGVLLHFPEVEIRNEDNQSHTIRDLVLGFRIYDSLEDPQDLMIGELSGNRYTYTAEEYRVNYRHSHLPTRSPNNSSCNTFVDACVGNGDLGSFLNHMDAYTPEYLNYERFLSFLLNIQSFAEWESKEGGPYIHFSDVERESRRLSSSSTPYLWSTTVLLQACDDINNRIRGEDMSELSFHLIEDRISVKPDQKFHDVMVRLLTDTQETRYRSLIHAGYDFNGMRIKVRWPAENNLNVSDSEINNLRDRSGRLPYVIIREKILEFSVINKEEEEAFSFEGFQIIEELQNLIINNFNETIAKEEFRKAYSEVHF